MSIESDRRVIPVALALLLSFVFIFSLPGSEAAPEGYVTMEDILAQYPSAVVKEGDDYRIITDLDLPATKLLFLAPGERLLFDQGIYLNMTGAPLFEGTEADQVYLGPNVPGEIWGGINIMEADITTPSVIRNTTIEGAVIGIRSHSSDLHIHDSRIMNCSRNAMDIKGPLPPGNEVIIDGCTLMNASYYGIHLLKANDVTVTGTDILECGTGVRTFGSTAEFEDTRIIDSKNIGMNPVNSDLWIDGISLSSGIASTSNQILVLNSAVQMFDGEITGAKTAVYSGPGSDVHLDGIRIDESYTDGVWVLDSRLSMLNSEIKGSGESALHLKGAEISIIGTDLINNGGGTGDLVFSSVYSDSTKGKFENCDFIGSGYAHVHALSSALVIGNSTLGSIQNERLVLDGGSRIELIDVIPPSDISLLDGDSELIYRITMKIQLRDYSSADLLVGAQVDLRNTDNVWVGTAYTGPDGWTDHILVTMLERNPDGIFSHLPIDIIAQDENYEVTNYSLESPVNTVIIDMYPPNDPPTLSLIGPINGTVATGSIPIEGTISDDLGIYGLKVRFDEGIYRSFTEFDSLTGGHFTLTLPLGNLSSGIHTIWIRAFDQNHISTAETRKIIVIDPMVNDTDEDGIPDINEDINGNGIVDEGETDPTNPDTDGDLLIDGIEIDESDGNSTDPLDPDTDGDRLLDGFEDQNKNGRVDANETDPNLEDTDGDGVNDSDDMYPLDEYKTKDVTDDGDSIAVIILATLFLIGLIVAVYLFIVKTRGASSKRSVISEKDNRTVRETRHRRDPEERERAGRRK